MCFWNSKYTFAHNKEIELFNVPRLDNTNPPEWDYCKRLKLRS